MHQTKHYVLFPTHMQHVAAGMRCVRETFWKAGAQLWWLLSTEAMQGAQPDARTWKTSQGVLLSQRQHVVVIHEAQRAKQPICIKLHR